ncbi:hypothetical protein FNF27_00644 [Cafeteria roenbergensis]|uniref:Uncharacterized protein n=1 Tax=Cafeteria roenbergensis TaxID=33653 RepID=A0A5A8EJL6_CAFRO|nr:hypothetical protein FNF27_00644 [Cafeteria roenbergensis]
MYGNGNRRPTDGGVFDGGYMSSHNIMPLMHPANPKAEAAMEMVRFTNDAAVLRYDPTRYASESGVRPGEEGEAAGPDEERLMVTARMALEEEYGAAVAERVAKRAEERARAEREKAEQAKPPPSAVDDSKRRNPRRAGVVRSGWGSGAEGDNGEGEDSAGAEAEAAAAAAAKAAKEDALGLHASLGRDARTMGYVTGFVSDLAGMPGRGYDSSRVRDMLVWDVEEEAEAEGAEEDVTERDVEGESKQGESAPNGFRSGQATATATAARSLSRGAGRRTGQREPTGKVGATLAGARQGSCCRENSGCCMTAGCVSAPGCGAGCACPRGTGRGTACSDPAGVFATAFEPRSTEEWDPRRFHMLPSSWTRTIPPAGRPSVRSEPAADALLMFD